MGFDFEWLTGYDEDDRGCSDYGEYYENYVVEDYSDYYDDSTYDSEDFYDEDSSQSYEFESETSVTYADVSNDNESENQMVYGRHTAFCDVDGVRTPYYGGFANHLFTDDEKAALAEGKLIKVGFNSKANPKVTRFAVGKLGSYEYNGENRYGFIPLFYEHQTFYSGYSSAIDRSATIGKTWHNHEFSYEEVNSILNGETVTFTSYASTGRRKMCECKLVLKDEGGSTKQWLDTVVQYQAS